MKNFAKLYEHPEYGQILVRRDTNDESDPVVHCIFDASFYHEDFEFITITIKDDNPDNSEEDREKISQVIFDMFTEALAVETVETYIPALKTAAENVEGHSK